MADAVMVHAARNSLKFYMRCVMARSCTPSSIGTIELATRWQHRLDRKLLRPEPEVLRARKPCDTTTGVSKRLTETSFFGDSSSNRPLGCDSVPDRVIDTHDLL
ncbi:SAGA-associated factor 29-like protein [Temnothorax longispinosus]|uniref:SAGA-associated factor 29-like protein n=1 Tax=Temnothorax longispinosus TaxID=300112 RepID=A0A4S2JJ54_9HYME|nr:SAGA-associated factor 29-like protein [Temnothorax longispinosus]